MTSRSSGLLGQLEAGFQSKPATPFQWKRKQNGYEIAYREKRYLIEKATVREQRPDHEVAYGDRPCLIEKAEVRDQQPEWYFPALEHPGLFREAADLDLSPTALANSLMVFTNRWGPLDDLSVEHIESYDLWPLRQLQWSVAAWDAYNTGSTTEVRRYFAPNQRGQWAFIFRVRAERLHVLDGTDAVEARRGRFRNILAQGLQLTANMWLQRASSPALLRNSNGSFDLRFVRIDLMGFLWVQFAEAIAGGKQYKQCDSCGLWMEISPEHGRPEKTYCSPACKQRAYRTRLKSATRTKRQVRPKDDTPSGALKSNPVSVIVQLILELRLAGLTKANPVMAGRQKIHRTTHRKRPPALETGQLEARWPVSEAGSLEAAQTDGPAGRVGVVSADPPRGRCWS